MMDGIPFDPGFIEPVWLGVGLLAVVAVLLLERGARRRREQAVRLFAASHLVAALTGSVSARNRRLKQGLLVAAVALLFLALARPHLFFRWSEETRSGLDVLLAIDCSKSMLTEDVRPNRLERAKLAIEDFADRLPDNRLGLIAFAGDAFLQCPLTIDHDAFQSSVRELDTDIIPRPGTDIALAIDEAVLALKSQPNNLKFVILVTDGEDLEGRVLDAAKIAAQAGLKIYTVGVGTPEGGLIPEQDENGGGISYLHDSSGQIVTSKLDEATLRQIAQITGGAYVPLGQRGEGLQEIYDRYIATLPKQQLEERREKIPFEQFEWPLALAILLLAWEFLIRERVETGTVPRPSLRMPPRPRRARPTAAVPLLLLGFFFHAASSSARAADPDTAEHDYQAGKFADAEQQYRDVVTNQPNRVDWQYDRGDAAFRAGEFDEAEEAFRKAMDTRDLGLQENAYYNLGNTQFEHGEAVRKVDPKETRALWEQALHSYESALKLREAADTRHNYDIVRRRLDELKQQQAQQNKNQQQQPNNQGQSQPNSSSGQGQDQNQNQSPQNPSGANNPPDNGQNPSQPPQQPGDSGTAQNAQPRQDKNAPAQKLARSTSRDQDEHDPGIKSREEAEALLDSLKDDEHHVTARTLNGNNETPPTTSGKDW
jgi:Ca-activated chloride channel family protein